MMLVSIVDWARVSREISRWDLRLLEVAMEIAIEEDEISIEGQEVNNIEDVFGVGEQG